MELYWNRILERRMMEAKLSDDTDTFDSALAKHMDSTLDFIRVMSHAIELEEVPVVLEILDRDGSITGKPGDWTELRADKLVKLLKEPCERYFDLVSSVMRSINFYLRLRKFLSKELIGMIVQDQEVGKFRAYSLMCQKLIEDDEQFRLIREAVKQYPQTISTVYK